MSARIVALFWALAPIAHAQAPEAAPAELAPLGPTEPATEGAPAIEPELVVAPAELAPLGVPITSPIEPERGEPSPNVEIAPPDPGIVVPPVPPEPPWPPDPMLDVRVVAAGVVTMAAWGGGFALRIDAGLIAIGDFSAIGIGIDVVALLGFAPWGNSGLVRADAPVLLTATWRARLAPNVELGVRGGASVSLPYELLVETSDYQVGVAVRGVGGAFTAFRVDRATQVLVGLDVHFGAGDFAVLSVGARI